MGQTRNERTWPKPERVRHVWARIDPRHPLAPPLPAVVVAWRRQSGQWEAWIVAVSDDGTVLQLWAPAERLRPIASDPNRAWRLR